MLRPFQDQAPSVADSAYVDPAATVVGDVRIEADATVLPGAVIRGDGGGEVVLEHGANVQDNVTIHADAPGRRVHLAPYAAIGHNAIVHNATLGERSLVGMGATVLDDAELEPESAVGANALVLEETTVETGTLVGGVPASVIKTGLESDNALFETGAGYVERIGGLQAGLVEESPRRGQDDHGAGDK